MDQRYTTVSDLAGHGTHPGAHELRRLDRRLRRHLSLLDRRVDDLLMGEEPLTTSSAAEIDILCAAIGEARELLDETRAEAEAHHGGRRRSVGRGPRRT